MNGREAPASVGEPPPLAALAQEAKLRAEHHARRHRAEADNMRRPDRFDLAVQPADAGRDLGRARALVQPPLAAELELEVLDDVGDVKRLAVDADGFERFVEQASRGPDERKA